MEKKLVKSICQIVSEYTDVTVEDMRGKSRREDIVDARFMSIYISLYILPYSVTRRNPK